MKEIKDFIKKINKKIKNSNYKEADILDDIKSELASECSINSGSKYCQQLKALEDLINEFIKNNTVTVNNKDVTKQERYLYRSIFRKLAKQHREQKYYDVLAKFPKRSKIFLKT